MNIKMILKKEQSAESLCADEVKALMLHAIDLLKYINTETQKSIVRAHSLIEDSYKKAA